MAKEERWEVQLFAIFLFMSIIIIPVIFMAEMLFPGKTEEWAGFTVQWGIVIMGFGPLLFVGIVAYAYFKHKRIVARLETVDRIKEVHLDDWEQEMEEEIEASFESPYESESYYSNRFPF